MNIRDFIQDFFKRKGAYIFSATIISKLLSFTLSIIIIRILSKNDYGNLMYAYTIISFIMPFMGGGIFQSFLKYAPIQQFMYERKNLFRYILISGTLVSLALSFLLIAISGFITTRIPEAQLYLILFSFLIVALFIFESVKNYLRIFFLNKAYAQLEIIQAVLVFIFGALLTWLIGAFGFIISLIIVPLFLSLYLIIKKQMLKTVDTFLNLSHKKLWYYGIYTSLGGLISALIFSVDIISIGNILKDASLVAQYKAISLIPFSLLFLPSAFIKTDFVKLVQKAKDFNYMKSYIINFMLVFLIISTALIVISYFSADIIISYLLGNAYIGSTNLFYVLIFGIVGAFIFRVPFGNILVAIGWTKINTGISISTLFLDIILNYFWIHEYGIIGAAYATSLLLWLSGISTFFVFIFYLKKIK